MSTAVKASSPPPCEAGMARSQCALSGRELNLLILTGTSYLPVILTLGLVMSFLASTGVKRELQEFSIL